MMVAVCSPVKINLAQTKDGRSLQRQRGIARHGVRVCCFAGVIYFTAVGSSESSATAGTIAKLMYCPSCLQVLGGPWWRVEAAVGVCRLLESLRLPGESLRLH